MIFVSKKRFNDLKDAYEKATAREQELIDENICLRNRLSEIEQELNMVNEKIQSIEEKKQSFKERMRQRKEEKK